MSISRNEALNLVEKFDAYILAKYKTLQYPESPGWSSLLEKRWDELVSQLEEVL